METCGRLRPEPEAGRFSYLSGLHRPKTAGQAGKIRRPAQKLRFTRKLFQAPAE
jgi:hypothetical protein